MARNENGSIDVNFLTKGTPTFNQYYVLDQNGEIIDTLENYDKQLDQKTFGKRL